MSIVANVDLHVVFLVVDELRQVDAVHFQIESRRVLRRHQLVGVQVLRWQVDFQSPVRIAINTFVAVPQVPSGQRCGNLRRQVRTGGLDSRLRYRLGDGGGACGASAAICRGVDFAVPRVRYECV